MNRNQFEKLRLCGVIAYEDLDNKEERTLLYGYTCDRSTWHVYVKDHEIHTIMYGGWSNSDTDVEEINVQYNSEYVPDKRLYPKACDYEFCSLLASHGVALPFTVWSDDIKEKQFYGKTI